jgi:hypothetical protein
MFLSQCTILFSSSCPVAATTELSTCVSCWQRCISTHERCTPLLSSQSDSTELYRCTKLVAKLHNSFIPIRTSGTLGLKRERANLRISRRNGKIKGDGYCRSIEREACAVWHLTCFLPALVPRGNILTPEHTTVSVTIKMQIIVLLFVTICELTHASCGMHTVHVRGMLPFPVWRIKSTLMLP